MFFNISLCQKSIMTIVMLPRYRGRDVRKACLRFPHCRRRVIGSVSRCLLARIKSSALTESTVLTYKPSKNSRGAAIDAVGL